MEDPENRLIWGVREVDHLFSRFARYTKFVLFSKWFLGVFAILLMTSLIAWPLLSKDQSGIRITFTGNGTGGSSVASPVMNNPEYEGTDAKGQQFKISGERAIQKTPDLVIVEKVQGQLLRPNGSWTSLSSDTAEYKQKAGDIQLIGDVVVADDTGYIFTTSRAAIDTNTMHVTGTEPVEGDGPKGKLLATGFEIGDNGKVIRFGSAGHRVNVHLEKMRQE